ncbi:MAG TPA: hypothetical protein PKX94_09135, partial [Opitutales bacterium]|nr:hypothetical protein [Opitutales bacterium]
HFLPDSYEGYEKLNLDIKTDGLPAHSLNAEKKVTADWPESHHLARSGRFEPSLKSPMKS